MSPDIVVRPALESDFNALSRMDLTYSAGRVLALQRSGDATEPGFQFVWRERKPETAIYNHYPVDRLAGAIGQVALMLVAEARAAPCGLLMAIVPQWTDAMEITDLAVDRAHRRRGIGQALVEAAAVFAADRTLRAMWVEPRSDNAEAIEFYLRLGFRISGFNDRMHSNNDAADGRLTLYMYREL